MVSYLHSHFWKIHLHGKFFPAVHVRIMRLLECSLQFVELVRCKRCPIPTVLLFARVPCTTASTAAAFARRGGHIGWHTRTRSFILAAALVVVLTPYVRQTIVRVAVFTCTQYKSIHILKIAQNSVLNCSKYRIEQPLKLCSLYRHNKQYHFSYLGLHA